MQRKRRRKQSRLIVPAVILLAAAAAAGVMWSLAGDGENARSPEADAAKEEDPAPDVVWKGQGYNYNDHLSNYLFIGVDSREKEETDTGSADAGQADAVYLVSWDRVSGDAAVITIPRDTMTQIEVMGPGGESLGKNEDHISLSYAYGDGGHESCQLTKEAVSELFYGLPIQGYCSINIDAVPILTESVGGVTVTVPNDSLEKLGPEFSEGAQIRLDGEKSETFVRYRDTAVSQSALSRMQRQQEYIRAFGQAAQNAGEGNPEFVTELYDQLEPYMVTNMGSDQFADILKSISSGGGRESWTVPGEAAEGDTYDEYHVDDDALYEKIIDTFYQPEN